MIPIHFAQDNGRPTVEFWSSVEYGTFLKGLVRELCGASAAKEEGGMKSAEVGSGCANKAESGGRNDQGPTPNDRCPLNTLHPDGSQRTASGGNRVLETGDGKPETRNPRPETSRGDAARQRFAVGENEYRQARGTLARLRMRWRCYVGYPLQLRRRIRRAAAPQALVVCTNTFYAPWVAMRAARKREIPVVHWVFDLFPDVLILAGKVRPGSLAERWLRRWVRAMFDGAAANVFLGERLLAFAETKFGPIPRSVVIPVGCDATPFADKEPADRRPDRKCGNQGGRDGGRRTEGVTAKNAESTKNGGRSLLAGDQGNEIGRGASTNDDKEPRDRADGGGSACGLVRRGPVGPRLLYCGNFGRMHEVDTVAQVLRSGLPTGVKLDFRGNGAGFQELARATAGCANASAVSFGGSLTEPEWLETMAAADVALVTMKPGAEGIVMPSKTYSAMAAGQAILAVCPRESDLADTVTKHDCGWVIEPGDAAGLRTLLEALPSRGEEVLRKRRNAWQAAQECYDQRVLAKRWRELLGGLGAEDRHP